MEDGGFCCNLRSRNGDLASSLHALVCVCRLVAMIFGATLPTGAPVQLSIILIMFFPSVFER